MRPSSVVVFLSLALASCSSWCGAFEMAVTRQRQRPPPRTTVRLAASRSSNAQVKSFQQTVQTAAATALLTASLWTAPAFLAGSSYSSSPIATAPVLDALYSASTANAKEMASGSGSRVNKDAESLLRLGLPISNKEVRKLQTVLEDVKLDIGSKRKSAALDGVKKARTMLAKPDKMVAACRDSSKCADYAATMAAGLDPLQVALKESQEAFNGSEQERSALDQAYAAQTKIVNTLTLLEEQMIPPGYTTPVPAEFDDMVQLQGRATVNMVVTKADKSNFPASLNNGKAVKQATLKMVIDGYAAPVTGGNFVDLVQRGFYDGMEIQRSDGFVVQTGDPAGEADGYVGAGGKQLGNGPHGERLIPLEIFVKGDKGPIYETSIEDEGRGGEATVLPFSSYGAMGWAREEYDPNTGSSQFFWLLFDSDLTPAGKNVLDGRYPCFGYVVEGADFLSDIKEGDVIVSAKVTAGAENIVAPKK